ncbi:hypothetical protein B566_EDAN012373 [Ephemera danica]|nr:hypothetical protein B566_EDAN012373 [Ephemera danica]
MGTEMDDSKQQWYIDCSDDERYEGKDEGQSDWLPDTTEIQQMFETLEKNRILDINWQCPGRKHPSADDNNALDNNEEEEGETSAECTDFDFADEVATPKLRREQDRNRVVRKKPTSFDSVLSNMQRHRQLEQCEKQQTKENS